MTFMASSPLIDKNAPVICPLLIGVSDYRNLWDDNDDLPPREHLGLRKLSSPALTIYRIHEWLERHRASLPLPLAASRILISPSADELKKVKGLDVWPRASLANVLTAIKEWRDDLARNPESIAFFYFAGHGVKRKRRDDVLLLDDFGGTPQRILKDAIDSTSLLDGMAPSNEFPHIARTQLYFFDACRVKPQLFRSYENVEADPIWDKTELAEESRC